jgi:hypothetical protein
MINNKIFFKILSIVFLFTSCQVSVNKEVKVEKYYPDGKLESTGFMKNGKKTGIASLYYPNGKLKQQGQWANDQQEGVWSFYYEDGTILGKINFVNNFQNGLSVFYFPNGSIEQETQFKDGKPHGISKSYFRDINKVKEQSEWVSGKRNGILIVYDSLGTNFKKYLYREDKLIEEYK